MERREQAGVATELGRWLDEPITISSRLRLGVLFFLFGVATEIVRVAIS